MAKETKNFSFMWNEIIEANLPTKPISVTLNGIEIGKCVDMKLKGHQVTGEFIIEDIELLMNTSNNVIGISSRTNVFTKTT